MTSEEINALPDKVRGYIHDLETNCDPSGMVRENRFMKDQVTALQKIVKDESRERRLAVYCAALTGLLANPRICPDRDSMTIGDAERIAHNMARSCTL